jgi:hypothetical protein
MKKEELEVARGSGNVSVIWVTRPRTPISSRPSWQPKSSRRSTVNA